MDTTPTLAPVAAHQAAARPQPTGVVTLLFTDIENSSTLWEKYKDAFKPVLDAHDTLLREAAARHQGLELRHNGDGLFLTFAKASDAVLFAIAAQLGIARRAWSVTFDNETAPIDFRVRIGMHTCEAQSVFHPTGAIDYAGAEVNRAARVGGAAHGGQIVVSDTTRQIAAGQLPPGVAFKDLGTHRLKGVGEVQLWQVCGEGLPDTFPPPSSLNNTRVLLPRPSTPFIGREAEAAHWSREIGEGGGRLFTITGFGGMGKTRLALQIAERAAGAFRDGVYWVPLEDALTGEDMIGRIAEVLRPHLQPASTVEEQVLNFHRGRNLLLVLDNLEQIEPTTETARIVSALLKTGPHVKCLVTSRRDLGLDAEQRIELDPLTLAEAKALFVDRARARKPSFVLDQRAEAEVAAICTTLEGLPLAVELAASMILLVPLPQLLKRLHDQLRLLKKTAPEVAARHLALRAAIDWSYNLLAEGARSLFAQLSVFAGGFTLEAAEAVCESADLLAGLMELRTQSLLRGVADQNTGDERLTMLQALREYGAEKLRDQATGRRHFDYYLAFARERAQSFKGRDEAGALREVEAEFGNLSAALAWAVLHDSRGCVLLATHFCQASHLLGRWQEALQVQGTAQNVLAQGNAGSETDHPEFLFEVACLADDLGQRERALAAAEMALRGYRAAGNAVGAADALNLLGVMATDSGEGEHAVELLQEALSLRAPGDAAGRARTLLNLARQAERDGQREAAWQLYEQSNAQRRLAGDDRGLATAWSNMGALAQQEGDYGRARELYLQSLELRRRLRDRFGIAVALHNLAELGVLEGDTARAIALFVHAERLFRELESPYVEEPLRSLRELRRQQGDEAYGAQFAIAQRSVWEEVV